MTDVTRKLLEAEADAERFSYMRCDSLARLLVDRHGIYAPEWAKHRAASRGYPEALDALKEVHDTTDRH